MTDYWCYPLWDCDNGGDLNPEDLEISKNLKQDLKEWAETFDNILDLDDPANSGFKSIQEEEEFERRGLELWEHKKNELGDEYCVQYFSQTQHKVLGDRLKF
ncbi:MAG: hypothetical protein SWY16_14740 [Cyanobacteriota bacterium]|nr:hypothetical protein [Cyanobacteriota bacterium]